LRRIDARQDTVSISRSSKLARIAAAVLPLMTAPITSACLSRPFDIVCSPGQRRNAPSRSPDAANPMPSVFQAFFADRGNWFQM
jgi:hypothetical protein